MKPHIPFLAVAVPAMFAPFTMWAQAAPQAQAARLGTESGFGIFQQKCMICHGKEDAPEKAPDPQTLRQLAPERILDALTNGVMKIQGQSLTDEEKRRVAESVSGRLLGTATAGDAKNMPNQCPSNPPMKDPSAGPAWNGWGVDAQNTRFQSARAAGITPDNVGRLKLKWAFGFPGGLSAFGQPSAVSGRVFVGSDNAFVYSLDSQSGCVYWSFMAKAGIRNAMTVAPVEGQGTTKYALFFGDLKGTMYALDAHDGKLLWSDHPEEHFTARFTAAPTFYEGKLYAGVSSWEEFSARTLDYPCCTSRGSVVAWDANTGRRLWHSYVIPEEPKPVRKNSKGVQLWAPAGASVWNSPTVDPKRKLIYVGTGDATTEPAAKTSDAVVAMDMATGKIVWSYQAEENDAFLVGCNGSSRTENCPSVNGPDYDIGNSPMLRDLPGGKTVVVAGTKNGFVFALDPDRKGALVWKTEIFKNASGTPLQRINGIVWGGAADPQFAYFGGSGGGVAAVQLSTGERAWFNALGTDAEHRVWMAAGTTAVPGVIFVPAGDGKLRALSSKDGRSLWEFDTNRSFETTNKVQARGGSIRAPGMAVAGGMVFAGSGYGFGGNDIPGNVLLAFGVE